MPLVILTEGLTLCEMLPKHHRDLRRCFLVDGRTKHTVISHGVTIRYAMNSKKLKFIWLFIRFTLSLQRNQQSSTIKTIKYEETNANPDDAPGAVCRHGHHEL